MIDVGDEDRDEAGDEDASSSRPRNLAMTMGETTSVATSSHVGAVGGFRIGESYIGTQMQTPNPFTQQPNQIMGAMSALANEDQEFETSMTNSTSELLADALPLYMDLSIGTNDYLTLNTVSLVTGSSRPGEASLESWMNGGSQSPSFDTMLSMISPVGCIPVPREASLESCLNKYSQSLSFDNSPEAQGMRILS